VYALKCEWKRQQSQRKGRREMRVREREFVSKPTNTTLLRSSFLKPLLHKEATLLLLLYV
jgi:hypothetical protein